ncbi:MAG: dinitrogenase iron-molybdenum cofactor biosynthesis protein [Chloroflexi bacterium]|nr:dinitrogenase iron-molybdenum cofactor biosynthesis protein [Chloroflexota bacterium]
MKLIVTATAPELEASVDPRFGRGAYFVVVDTETMRWQAHENQGMNAAGGAGSLAAQFAAQQGAEAVISGDFGPNAYVALAAGEIKMVLLGPSKTVREAVANFTAGTLEQVSAPTGAGHHGGHGGR